MATHSSVLAWEIPWTENPDGLQFMGSQTIGLNCVTKPPPFTYLAVVRAGVVVEGNILLLLAGFSLVLAHRLQCARVQ